MEENQETIQVYKPEIIKESALPLDPQAIAYAPKLVDAAKDGMIPVTLEDDVVIQRISHDLYANASSGFRELFNNEARACRIAKKKYGANPKIVITVVPSKRSLTIQGFDSTGMSQDRFLQIFTKLGRSDNFDEGEIGQFGFGRAAYTTLSEIMILKTWARDTNEKYAVMGKNGIGYNIIPMPELESYGTRVELTLYEKVSFSSIIKMALECARFCDVDTFLNLEEDFPDEYDYRELPKIAGMHKIGSITFQEYYEEKTQKIIDEAKSDNNFRYEIPVVIHDEDFVLYGMYIFTNHSPWKEDEFVGLKSYTKDHYLCLLGTPIDGKIETNLTYMHLNVKNERKYRPTPDRERFADESIEMLQKKVDEKISEAISFLNIETSDDFLKSDKKAIYERYVDEGFIKYLDVKTRKVVGFLNVGVVTKEKPTKKIISNVLATYRKLVCLEKINEAKIAAIKNTIPNAVFFKLESPTEENHQLLRDFGVIFGEDYLLEQKIKVQRIEKELTEVVVHSARQGYLGNSTKVVHESERILVASIPENVIRIGNNFKQAMELLSLIQTTYKIVKDHPKLNVGLDYNDFLAKLGDKSYSTSDGPHLLKEICYTKKAIYLSVYPDADVLKYLKNRKTIVIASDEDEIFEIMLYLKNKSKTFVFDTIGKTSWNDSDKKGTFGRFIPEQNLTEYEFTVDRWTNHIDDPQILMGIVHAAKKIKNQKLLNIFLNAARYSRNKEDNTELLKNLFVVNELLEANN